VNIKIFIIKFVKKKFIFLINFILGFFSYQILLKKLDKIDNAILFTKKKKLFLERKLNYINLINKNVNSYKLLREYCYDLFYNCDLEFVKRFNELNFLREELIKRYYPNLNKDFIRNFYFKGSFGNILAIWAYLESMKIGLSYKKDLIFLNDSKKLTNPHIFKYFKKYITEYHLENSYDNLNFLDEILWPDLGDYIPMKNGAPNQYFSINKILSEKKQKNILEPLFKLSENDKIIGDKILKEFGISASSWHVTLHVRISGYRTGDKDYFRNADIFNYLPAIETVIKKGGIVFRVGDKSMPALPKIKGLIDYCHTTLKSDFMDVYLAATSKFIIGTSSGYWSLGRLFNIPVLMTNCPNASIFYTMTDNDIFLPKKIFGKDSKKILSLEEFFSPNLAIRVFWNDYIKNNNIILEENTSEDLKMSTDLMITNFIFNNKSQKITTDKYQNLSNDITNRCGQVFTKNKINSFAKIPDFILKNYSEFN
jgi:putative glycosyltransferase (TIGR04372 family)